MALNNLAFVQMRLGELDEAERNALKAVEAGGKTQGTAKETLMKIRAQKQSS